MLNILEMPKALDCQQKSMHANKYGFDLTFIYPA